MKNITNLLVLKILFVNIYIFFLEVGDKFKYFPTCVIVERY